MFFYNGMGGNPPGLYRTDGTVPGTVRLSDAGLPADHPIDLNGVLLFPSYGADAWELWRSDGTSAGTYRLKAVSPRGQGVYVKWAYLNGQVFFWADTPGAGWELWKSDGTTVGTVLVKDINPGPGPAASNTFGIVNGTLMFFANDGTHGMELWRTDGTAANTQLVADLTPGPASTDGWFYDRYSGAQAGDVARSGTGVFTVRPGTAATPGIWHTDGTAAGTRLLRPGDGSVIEEIDGIAFLAMAEAGGGSELWRSDGTPDGTFLVKDIRPGPSGADPGSALRFNDLLVFAADDGASGREPWRSDGTANGTYRLKDVLPGPGPGYFGQWKGGSGNGCYFFSALSGTSTGLWQTDGTSPGTLIAADTTAYTWVTSPFSASGDRLFFNSWGWRLLAYPLPRADATRGDIFWRHRRTGEVSVWLMNGVSREREVRIDHTTLPDASWEVAGTADFNGDRRMDLLWRHVTSGQLEAWFLDGTRRLRATPLNPPVLSDPHWRIVATGDFNGDTKADIVWRHSVSGQIAVWYMDGVSLVGGTFTTPAAVDPGWKLVGTGRFDADYQTDLLWWHAVSGQLVVWHMNGTTLSSGEFTSPSALPDTSWRPVAVGDYNGDRNTDIVWHHVGSGQVVVWHMDGVTLASGTLTSPEARLVSDWTVIGPR
jgi:ELWxxDGT repeat protein